MSAFVRRSAFLRAPASLVVLVAIIDSVAYDATAVDDGDILDVSRCTLGAEVSPDPNGAFADTDTSDFECAFDCSAVGASVAIEYE